MGGPKAIRCRIEVAHGVKESPAVVLEPRDTYERVWLQLCRCLRGRVDRVLSRAAARDRQSAARGRFVHLAPLADSDGVHQQLCALAVCIRMGWRCKSGFAPPSCTLRSPVSLSKLCARCPAVLSERLALDVCWRLVRGK